MTKDPNVGLLGSQVCWGQKDLLRGSLGSTNKARGGVAKGVVGASMSGAYNLTFRT